MARIELKDVLAGNKLLQRHEPTEVEYNQFVNAFGDLKSKMAEAETELEDVHEDYIIEFLKKSFYQSTNEIKGKKPIDLAIFSDAKGKGNVQVIIEAKRVAKTNEFPTFENINVKALQETVLYFMRESVSKNNNEIRRIVITNAKEWYIFDAQDFERFFVRGNKKFKKKFEDFEKGVLSITTTDEFYPKIAEPAIEEVKDKLDYIYFDISKITNEKDLLIVYKILSPYYLLKKPCATDSNILNKDFYNELLYIIGLREIEINNKKVIGQLPEKERERGSLLENTITQLSYKKNPFNLFERAIQLVIVWVNRILFLKLLEAQLIKWNDGDESYKFLTPEKLKEYDTLQKLFFGVLARQPDERDDELTKDFQNIPYLNSSLFEHTEELSISELADDVPITVYDGTVLNVKKDEKMKPLEYMLRFLDAYDFGAVKSENGRRKENKTLINASVLGLIFEKINGYKDGSFFTPGTITQYMCRETIGRAVVQKFNIVKEWDCKTLSEVKNKCAAEKITIEERNKIIDSITVCDPAVGSGHFLVSALNELIYIKFELNALCLTNGNLLDGELEIENDELIVTRNDRRIFAYNPNDKYSQMIQETLFNEKRKIIENCLFGVDINPNSVNICRLRLWIELLKNAYYYINKKGNRTLETLPNIDINIKCGNSLVSRYDIGVDISKAQKKKELADYKNKVLEYKDAPNKIVKHELEEIIEQLKGKFQESVKQNSDGYNKYQKARRDLSDLESPRLFEPTKKEKKEIDERIKCLKRKIAEYEENQKNSIFENAMEWRWEFPEVLDTDGNFKGFDVVIGNPPYIYNRDMDGSKRTSKGEESDDFYISFIKRGDSLLAANGYLAYITPNTYFTNISKSDFRKWLLEKKGLNFTYSGFCFEDAYVETEIVLFNKKSENDSSIHFHHIGQDDEYSCLNSVFLSNYKCRIFLPNETNLSLYNKIIRPLVSVYNNYENAILGTDACRDLVSNDLKNSRVLPIGAFCEGAQGLVTGNNSKYLIKICDSVAEEEKIANELLQKFNSITREVVSYEHFVNNRNAFYERCETLKIVKANPVLFGKFFIYKTTARQNVRKYNNLSENEKQNGGEKGCYVEYFRGNKDGYTYYVPANTCIDWCSESLKELRDGEKTNSRWQGEKYFNSTGFAWVDYFTDKIKAYCVESGPYSKDVVKLHSTITYIPDKYIVAILNSKLISYLCNNFITATHTLQINDGRLIPIALPNQEQLNSVITIVDQILADKKQNPQAVSDSEHELDLLVYHLYGLTFDEVKLIDETVTEEEFAAVE
ncbi:MAG: Eco57I restriction-modification methylase domain-containing protein [Salinivirgaceae bacterium]|nr:Eco57I restriction-modification methylase domain-containing protein [Salinivirgaceae bacterium]